MLSKRHKLIKQIYTVTGFPPVEPMFHALHGKPGIHTSYDCLGLLWVIPLPATRRYPLPLLASLYSLFFYEGPFPYLKLSFEPLRRVRKPLKLWRIRETLWSTCVIATAVYIAPSEKYYRRFRDSRVNPAGRILKAMCGCLSRGCFHWTWIKHHFISSYLSPIRVCGVSKYVSCYDT